MVVLGVETSCDETAFALVADGRKVLATQVASSLKSHQKYGGVVPEIASRVHVELFTYELDALFSGSGIPVSQVDRIAVTHGPGLPGSLVIGISAAKSLALAWRKPIVPVNHLHAHLYGGIMGAGWDLDVPMIGLIISGGHTALVRMSGVSKFSLLGETRDDAVGEAFDKVAKLLQLGFPGGPEIQRAAERGNPKAYKFSVPKIKSGSAYDFSFSGIKTAVLYKVRKPGESGPVQLDPQQVADLAASFQHAVVEEVVMKAVKACRTARVRYLVVGGGVIANGPLRQRLKEVCSDFNIEVAIPPMSLCTDNGSMIAGIGFHLQPVEPSKLTAVPDLNVGLN